MEKEVIEFWIEDFYDTFGVNMKDDIWDQMEDVLRQRLTDACAQAFNDGKKAGLKRAVELLPEPKGEDVLIDGLTDTWNQGFDKCLALAKKNIEEEK